GQNATFLYNTCALYAACMHKRGNVPDPYCEGLYLYHWWVSDLSLWNRS
ncbi:34871_t:CDS:2, partial [Racocetra persica]